MSCSATCRQTCSAAAWRSTSRRRGAVIATRVAEPLGLSLEAAARGILAIVDNHMVGAMRVVSVERGHDPRDFTLVPFGGAGPLHGCALAELLGISSVLIPPAPGVLCADGLLAADLKAEFSRTLPRAGAIDVAEAEGHLRRARSAGATLARRRGRRRRAAPHRRVALLRYHGQGGELAVGWAGTREAAEAAFAAEHQALYGFTLGAAIELVTLRVEATGLTAQQPAIRLAGSDKVEAYRPRAGAFRPAASTRCRSSTATRSAPARASPGR